MNLSCSFT